MIRDQRIEAFESTLRASHEWVAAYAAKLGQTHPPLAFSCLRGALHVLRDRLPTSEIAALASQLPMLLRGAYYEGWQPGHRAARLRTADDLYHEVSRELADGLAAPPRDVMRALFGLLDERVSAGEVQKLRHVLPQPMQEMWSTTERAAPAWDEAHPRR
jgi:uncharacterized protein (DUF2267 family)